VNLRNITVPAFVTGAVADHLTPWKGCYRTTQLLGGPSTFVLSYSGHIASLVNPPGNPKAHYWTGGTAGEDPSSGWPAPRNSWAAGGSHGPSGQRHVPATASPDLTTLAASDTR
jgi:poly(3-hydroxyalkanoate) synthetase